MLLLFAACAAAASYQLIAITAALLHLRRSRGLVPTDLPPVSILKPVRGRDERMYEAIRSHAVQAYPRFEILFGVADPVDPAVGEIERLRAEFPECQIRLVHSTAKAPNGKVAILSDLLPEARFPILIVNDSDIRVPSDYLRHVVAGLADSETGLVTCLYRPAADTAPAHWESLGITTDFAPSVLAALLLGVNEFALGSTLAFRAADLSRVGGFEAFSDYIADDYQLGKRIASSGKRIRLSHAVVETYIAGRTWRDVWNHQVRWAATVRVSQGAGYAGLPVANATFWSIVALAGGLPFLALFLLLLRYATGFLGAAVLRDRAPLRLWYLLPFRDLWGLVVWAAGWSRREVIWRDRRLRLDSRGRILSVK